MYNPVSNKLLNEILSRSGKHDALDEPFLLRLAANFQDIFNFFHRLYPHQDDLWDHLEQLVNQLINCYLERPASLKESDKQRLTDPTWMLSEQLVGMMLYTDRFAGDLQGLRDKIPYLEELGINLIHLMPILKCPEKNNDGGYAVSDYKSINPEVGTMEDVRLLASELREKGMVLMMDLVLNHTSNEHEWAHKARQGDPTYQGYYYFFDDRTIPNEFEQSLPQVFPESSPGNFSYIDEVNKWVMTVFHHYQWDLNYSNPRVFLEMLDVILNLANQGIDILRLDALAFMWKKMGTSSQNLPEAHLLIKAFKSCVQVAAPGTLFLAEAIVAPEEIIKYFGKVDATSDECDMAYNATLMTLLWDTVATKNNQLLWTTLHNVPHKPKGTTWLNYLRCHDDIGLGYEDQHAAWAGYTPWDHRQFLINFLTGNIEWSFARGRKFMEDKHKGDARISGSLASLAGLEKALDEEDQVSVELALKRILMLHNIIISYGGIPLLYAGDELAMLNDYSYQNDPSHANDNRWMHRPKMDWGMAKKRNEAGSIESIIFHGLKRLIQLRKELPALADSEDCFLVDCHNQHLLAYIRGQGASRVFVVSNLNDHPEFLKAEIMHYMGFELKKTRGVKDLVTGKNIRFEKGAYELLPHQFIWITQQ